MTALSEPQTDRRAELAELAAGLADRFATRAAMYDRENRFPFENFAELRDAGYLALTVPKEYGGGGINAIELAAAQERLAQGDGSTALGVTMHLGLVGRLAEARIWPEEVFARVCRDIVEHGALINSAHSEPDLGSPSRGALPSTTAVRTDSGWVINGRKSWTTLAPALTYAQTLAAASGDGQEPRRANFLIRLDQPGVTVLETWDNHGMRATSSHDLLLENVEVPADALVPDGGSTVPGEGKQWGVFAGQAVFLGLATAACNFAIEFAKNRRPNGLPGPIAELQTIQHRIAEMQVLLLQARTVMEDTALRWERYPEERDALTWRLAAVKYTVSNHAIKIGDIALRVTGSAGLSRNFPLERIVRDLRVSIGQPPIDDMALTQIGRAALGL
ncbi:MAG: acyl-CoA/acyl-ACP dehydrogenase [Thermomicrobiales bacterium]|nr:acyl-CoA/acyl-ACP dehydrogenase [Thermomicrobiales bacterium]